MDGRPLVCPIGSPRAFQRNITASACLTSHLATRCTPNRLKSVAAHPESQRLSAHCEVGVRQPLKEARELAESAYSLRADVLRELLQHCSSVKTVRLCLQFGRELSLPWAAKLDPAQLPTGSSRAWVSRSPDGLLVLKP